jgi:hypothetical protein
VKETGGRIRGVVQIKNAGPWITPKYVLLGLAVLVVAQANLWRSRHYRNKAVLAPPNVFQAGDTLPRLYLVWQDPRDLPGLGRVRLDSIFPGGCGILVFFSPSCPYSHSTASTWAGRTGVQAGSDTLSVRWVSMYPPKRRTGAFIDGFDLPVPWLSFGSQLDRIGLGVTGSPTLFLIGPGGTLIRRLSQDPARVGPIPPSCHPEDAFDW